MYNTKVVDLEKLSKSGIQHFSFEAQKREKIRNYRTDSGTLIYLRICPCQLLLPPFSLHHAHDGVRTPAPATWPPTRRASAQNCSCAPCFPGTAPPWQHCRTPRALLAHALATRLPWPAELPRPCAPPPAPSSPANSPPARPPPPPLPIKGRAQLLARPGN